MMDYLKVKWLRQGWVHVVNYCKAAIAGSVWEIYTNAFEHAQSPIGVFSCGQHYPRRKELQLTVADFGVGIPSTVRLFFSNDQRTFFKRCELSEMGVSTGDDNETKWNESWNGARFAQGICKDQ